MATSYQERVDEIVATMTPQQRAVWDHSQSQLEDKLGQVLLWLSEFQTLVDLLEHEGLDTPWHAVHLFWIRLHGLLSEFTDDIESKHKLAKRSRYEPVVGAAAGALRQLRGSLADEDIVVADWCRQRAAHVFQKGYSLQLQQTKRGQVVKDSYLVRVLGQQLPIELADDIIARVMTEDGHHCAAAVRIAKKLAPHVKPLCAAVSRMHSTA